MSCPENDNTNGACRGPKGECLCAGAGPALSHIVSEVMSHFAASPEVRRHFDRAGKEVLMGIRAWLDETIEARGSAGPSRGTKFTVD